MNRLTLTLLLSLAICSLAVDQTSGKKTITPFDDVESQMSIYPDNAEETSALDGSKRLFTDFCITTRDNVMGDIRRTTKNIASSVFSLFFKSFEHLGLGSAQDQKADEENPTAEATEIEKNVDSSQPATEAGVPQQNKPRSIYRSVIGALSATKDAVTNSVVQSLSSIKTQLGLKTVGVALRRACDKVSQFQTQMNEQFEETKKDIGAADLATLKIADLQCVTTGRVMKMDNFCRMVMAAQEPVLRVLT